MHIWGLAVHQNCSPGPCLEMTLEMTSAGLSEWKDKLCGWFWNIETSLKIFPKKLSRIENNVSLHVTLNSEEKEQCQSELKLERRNPLLSTIFILLWASWEGKTVCPAEEAKGLLGDREQASKPSSDTWGRSCSKFPSPWRIQSLLILSPHLTPNSVDKPLIRGQIWRT